MKLTAAITVLVTMQTIAFAGIKPGSKDLGAIWCVGDSITQSNGDADPNSSPRKSLHDLLKAGGYTFTFTGHFAANPDGLPATGNTPETNLHHFHSGVSGSVIGDNNGPRVGMTQNLGKFWTSGRLATVKPNVILLMLGANDTNSNIDIPQAPARLATMLDAIHALPGIGKPTVLIGNVTPIRTSPTATANVTALNAALPGMVKAAAAKGYDVHFVDQFTPIEAEYAKMMCPDHLHPNTAGNACIAKQWFAKIEELAAAE
ncbi:MAG: GDSL-type esterase/lipase family protein [Verrucomicrobiota bacterium]